MAKKSKKLQPAAEQPAVPAASESAAAASEVVAPAEPEVPEQLDLHDAARRFVPGFQERWWDGIRKHATAMGFGAGGTEEQCKTVLRHWGAKC